MEGREILGGTAAVLKTQELSRTNVAPLAEGHLPWFVSSTEGKASALGEMCVKTMLGKKMY